MDRQAVAGGTVRQAAANVGNVFLDRLDLRRLLCHLGLGLASAGTGLLDLADLLRQLLDQFLQVPDPVGI